MENGRDEAGPDLTVAHRYQSLLCPKRRCCVTGLWPAGKDRRGRNLSVVAVSANDACLIQTSVVETDDDESEASAQNHACHDYWLVTEPLAKSGKPARLQKTALALNECDYDKWETEAAVDAAAQTFTFGGSSLFGSTRTARTTVIGLNPLRLVEEQASEQGRDASWDRTWNFDRFAGSVDLGIEYCPGKAPPDAGVDDDRDAPTIITKAIAIPRVALPESFRQDGWRKIGLGRCSTLIDGNDHGFTVHGAKSTAADSLMRLLLSLEGELFVVIEDNRMVSGGASWVADDHLEIWSSPAEGCLDPKAKSSVAQWGIRAIDGKVFPGMGATAGLKLAAEVQKSGRSMHLKVLLPPRLLAGRFSIVYSDSDNGVRQKRLIGTSTLGFGKWWTFGVGMDEMDPKDACVVGQKTLQPRLVPIEKPPGTEPLP